MHKTWPEALYFPAAGYCIVTMLLKKWVNVLILAALMVHDTAYLSSRFQFWVSPSSTLGSNEGSMLNK